MTVSSDDLVVVTEGVLSFTSAWSSGPIPASVLYSGGAVSTGPIGAFGVGGAHARAAGGTGGGLAVTGDDMPSDLTHGSFERRPGLARPPFRW